MTVKAVLFDLDGTLLDIDMDIFLKHYFMVMVKMAEERGMPHKELPDLVMRATYAMISNLDPQRFNREVFEEHFYPHYPADERETRKLIDEFYDRGFPTLSYLCSPFDGIPEIVAKTFEKGFKVVVATNSVFPRKAIEDRLQWAGVNQFPYELVTTYENMHFTKPHLHYYREICEVIGVRPEECVVVGNDVNEDIVARKLGMKTFLLKERLIPAKEEVLFPDHEGYIEDLYRFISSL